MSLNGPQVGPFVGVVMDCHRTAKGRHFRLLIYQAYNANGLIGTEHNGIAILDDDRRVVVTDNVEKEVFGLDVPTRKQLETFKYLMKCGDDEFFDYVNSTDRLREEI